MWALICTNEGCFALPQSRTYQDAIALCVAGRRLGSLSLKHPRTLLSLPVTVQWGYANLDGVELPGPVLRGPSGSALTSWLSRGPLNVTALLGVLCEIAAVIETLIDEGVQPQAFSLDEVWVAEDHLAWFPAPLGWELSHSGASEASIRAGRRALGFFLQELLPWASRAEGIEMVAADLWESSLRLVDVQSGPNLAAAVQVWTALSARVSAGMPVNRPIPDVLVCLYLPSLRPHLHGAHLDLCALLRSLIGSAGVVAGVLWAPEPALSETERRAWQYEARAAGLQWWSQAGPPPKPWTDPRPCLLILGIDRDLAEVPPVEWLSGGVIRTLEAPAAGPKGWIVEPLAEPWQRFAYLGARGMEMEVRGL